MMFSRIIRKSERKDRPAAAPPVSGPNIILVHLGNDWFDYIDDCVAQARLFNPEVPLWLCASKQHRLKTRHDFDQVPQVHWVNCEELEPSPPHRRFLKRSKLDSKWRGGFWKLATERFFIMDELMRARSLRDCVHIENDTLLFTSCNQLMPVFQRQPAGILAPFDNDNRCVPSFIYLKDADASGKLCDFLAGASRKNTVNDMEALAQYRILNQSSDIGSLPIVPAGFQCSWTTPSGRKSADPSLYTHLADELCSIFDAAAIGQFLGGVHEDPNLRGFINESCVFDPSTFAIEWHKDIVGRRVPYVRWKGQLFRINNLHIHSKQLHRYVSTADPGK